MLQSIGSTFLCNNYTLGKKMVIMTINIQQPEKIVFYPLILFAIIIDYQYITLIVSERERGSNPSLDRIKKSPTINSLNSFSGERESQEENT